MWRSAAIGLTLFGLAGCVTSAGVYPANPQAQALGPLRISLVKNGLGAGPFTVWMPDGEVLHGRYSVNLGGAVGFGSLYASAYGTGGSASATGFGSSTVFAASSPAVADATGPRTTIHCEVMNGNYTGHGNGVCETSGGARYRVQY